MKIAAIAHNPPYQGGIVQYCVLLNHALQGKVEQKIIGFRSLYPPLLYKGKLPKVNRSGIQFVEHPENFITWYNPLSWVKAYSRLSKGDIIHLHWVSPLLAPMQYVILQLNNWFAKKPVVLTCHNIEPHEPTVFDKVFTKLVFNRVTDFVVHAGQNKERLVSKYGIKQGHVHVIHHGTFEFFTKWKKESKKELRKELGIDEKAPVLLFFGYIREYKGLRYLLKAMPEVIKKHKDVQLIVAGELWQKWNTYKQIIDKNSIKDNVKIFPRYIPDPEVHKFFDAADIAVLPYYNTEQTISGPLLVALAFGKPIIVSPVGGIKEMIKDGVNGILTPGADSSRLANNINHLIDNHKLQEKLSANALETNKEYRWERVGRQYMEVYEKIMKRNGKK